MANFFEQLWSTLKFIGFIFFVIIAWIISLFGDPNYTGGDPNALNGLARGQWWWVETYEECLDAIEQLESKGSTFDTSALFTYEGDEFDVKYCFVLENKNFLKYGRDNPFKYKNEDVKIYTYLFHKDTTIDDIAYSGIHLHCSYYFHLTPEYIENCKYQELDAEDLDASLDSNHEDPQYMTQFQFAFDYTDKETGEVVFRLYGFKEKYMPELSDEAVDAILDSIVIVENND